MQYRYKPEGGTYTSWQSVSTSPTSNKYSVNVSVTGLDYQTTYVFQARVTDKLTTQNSVEYTVVSEPIFSWGKNDFNFNVPVSFDGVTQTDFVVEQGEKNGWTYRKWNSGFAECWYSAVVEGMNVGAKNYEGFYYSETKQVSFPFTFTSVAYINASGGSTAHVNIVRPFNNTTTNIGYIVVGHAAVADATVRVNLEAKGKWK